MFVLLEGRTKDEAFVIGQQIADAVTNDNPKPVKLKLEKVLYLTFVICSFHLYTLLTLLTCRIVTVSDCNPAIQNFQIFGNSASF